jgi:hypothetical protein
MKVGSIAGVSWVYRKEPRRLEKIFRQLTFLIEVWTLLLLLLLLLLLILFMMLHNKICKIRVSQSMCFRKKSCPTRIYLGAESLTRSNFGSCDHQDSKVLKLLALKMIVCHTVGNKEIVKLESQAQSGLILTVCPLI